MSFFLKPPSYYLIRHHRRKVKLLIISARKTSITKLLSNDIHPLYVSQLSGHKKVDSLNSYYVASSKQQETMSSILNDSTNTLSADIENAMMQDWDDFLPPSIIKDIKSSSSNINRLPINLPPLYGAFQGASNCTHSI